ncbi:MAG TPA: prolyl oligopeptidase family serine peptidase [Gemmatimonadaceae bacterium]
MRMRRIIGWGMVAGIASAAAVVLGFGLYGVPAPPGVHTRHMPHPRWTSAVQLAGVVRELGASLGTLGWPAGPDQLWIATGAPPQLRVVVVRHPLEPGTPLPQLPPQLSQIVANTDPAHPLIVVGLDENGSERSRLYAWRPGDDSLVPITPPLDHLDLCCLNPSGSTVAFAAYRSDTSKSQVFVADARRPSALRAVMPGTEGTAEARAWSRDGRSLLMVEQHTFLHQVPFVADVETGRVRRLVPAWGDTVNVGAAVWSRDGTTIFLAADAGAEFLGVEAVDLATGRFRNLTADLPHDVADLQSIGGSDTLLVVVNDAGVTRLYALDGRSGSRWSLPAPDGYLRSATASPTTARVAEVVLGTDGRRAVYVLDVPAGRLTLWAQGAPPARAPLPPPQSLSYPTFDSVGGRPRAVNVIVQPPPAEFKAPWPVLIDLHGGPIGQELPVPDVRYAAFRRLGIAVLEPNVRGSTGFGKTFASLDDGRNRENAVRDIGALLDWIATQPDLDATRVAVIGGSAGGYLSLAALERYGDRLRCGVDLFGISSIPDALAESEHEFYPEVQRAEWGDERDPSMRAFLDSISPITHADRITVPVLIFQGANDARVKPAQSQRMVARLDSLGRTVWYVTAANEGHGLEHPLNQLYVGTAVLDLMKDYLVPDRR